MDFEVIWSFSAAEDLEGIVVYVARHNPSAAAFRLIHGQAPNERRKRTSARAHSFSTLSTVRPMRRATSGKLSSSKCRKTITSR